MSFECLDCKAIGDGYCSDCATPNDDLRELVEEFRERAEGYEEVGYEYDGAAYRSAANELEDLTNE